MSVLPHTGTRSTAASAGHAAVTLTGADGRSIPSWGKVYRTLRFGDATFPDVPFVLAAVAKPILGSDFFATNRLLVNTAAGRVLNAATLLPLGAACTADTVVKKSDPRIGLATAARMKGTSEKVVLPKRRVL